MIAQFSGETREEAIVNHFSLDIEEEEQFFQYVKDMGYTIYDSDDILENLIDMMRKKNGTIE